MTAKQTLPRNTYEDIKGQLYYVDKQTQKEYLIPHDKLKILQFLNERYVVGIAIGIVLYGIEVPIPIAGIIACMSIGLLSIYRSQKFLTSLKTGGIHKQSSQQSEKSSSYTILITIIIMLFTTLNCMNQSYVTTNKNAFYISIGIIILSCIFLIRIGYIAFKGKE